MLWFKEPTYSWYFWGGIFRDLNLARTGSSYIAGCKRICNNIEIVLNLRNLEFRKTHFNG